MSRQRAEHPFKRSWKINRLFVWFARHVLAGHMDVDGHTEVFCGGEIGEMSVEQRCDPFDVRGMADVPYDMQMSKRCLVGSGKI